MRRLLLVMLALAACSEPFDPYYRLTATRVLAVRSEPVAPATGETSTLSVLVYTTPGVPVDSYTWSWCPFAGPANAGYPCLVTEEDLAALGGGAASVPPFDLGHGATAELPNTIDPAILAAVCTGQPGQPAVVDCTGGFPAQLKVVVRAGGQEVTAVRGIRLRFSAEHEANANPTLEGIFATDQPLDGMTLTRRAAVPVRVAVPEAASESFTGRDDDGQPVAERERIILSWFVESGSLDDETTVFIDGVVPLDRAVVNEWEPDDAEDYPRPTADLFVIVRDSRDGVVWGRAGTVLK